LSSFALDLTLTLVAAVTAAWEMRLVGEEKPAFSGQGRRRGFKFEFWRIPAALGCRTG